MAFKMNRPIIKGTALHKSSQNTRVSPNDLRETPDTPFKQDKTGKKEFDFSKKEFDFSKKHDYSVEAHKKRQEEGIDWDRVTEGGELIGSFAPVAGEIIDAKNTVKDLLNKDYTGAALNAAGFVLPFIPGSIVKQGAKKIKDYIFKNIKGSKEAVKKSAKHIDVHGNYWKDPSDAAKINESYTNTLLQTPEHKLLGYTSPSVRFGKESLEALMKPVDLVNTKTLSNGTVVPTNMTWFSPNAGNKSFDIPGRNKFEAIIVPQNPYTVSTNRIWGVDKIKELINEGYDAIKVVGIDGVHSETVVLDKSIIDIVKK